MLEFFADAWQYIAGALTVTMTLVASIHAILYKRDGRSAVGWVGVIWLVPVLGAVFYVLLGINRVRRKAAGLRTPERQGPPVSIVAAFHGERLARQLGPKRAHLTNLAQLSDRVGRWPLVWNNRIEPLHNGDEAFPRMLEAIRSATRSVALATYIFDNGVTGKQFSTALADAVRRGVEVRVIVDGIGVRYTWPSVLRSFHAAGVPYAIFVSTRVPWPLRMPYFNLRTHRKILVVDGKIGFTGGMNIRDGHVMGLQPRWPIRDLHFELEGPVVQHAMRTFQEDWFFCTRERLEGETWFPNLQPAGSVAARGIPDGPDEDFDKLRWTILGALACARKSVRIVTPYFLPDQWLITSLSVAALRGVDVDIILPEENNLNLVKWASAAIMWQILEHGCRVYHTPPPFEHTKLMLVDGAWALIGSANWDPRSLRLNFEFNIECYDRDLVRGLEKTVLERIRRARRLTWQKSEGRNFATRLRDGIARLFIPYL